MNAKRLFGFVVLLFAIQTAKMAWASPEPKPKPGFNWDGMAQIAIQNHGRMKPLDTYARETAQFITGHVVWNGFSPVELLFSWLTGYDTQWENERFIKVGYKPLKQQLGLDTERSYFAPSELRNLSGMRTIIQGAVKKQQSKEKLNDLEKKAVEVQNQLGLLEAVVRGDDLTLLPNPRGTTESWFPLSALGGGGHDQLPYIAGRLIPFQQALKSVLDSYQKGDSAGWNEKVAEFSKTVTALSNGNYPGSSELKREILYNGLRPFRWAWVLYTLAFISLLSLIVTQKPVFRWASIVTLASAYGLHVFGFALRCLIAGRPPVTNMYESIIWVTFGCVTFSLLVWAVYKNVIIPTAATVFAIVGLVLADNLPAVLDPAINPLEPVLRSNYWLTIHVLTITLSYAAFALSLCLGNVVMGNYLFRPSETAKIQQLTLYMYRAVQIGVVLLATGTILGGVWADYSWGRFWGWDPKEVWALIALLLYIAVLHGRFAGWLKGFGFTAATVMCFLGVLMAWYGVNFVLGVGLHSYGFGSGGMSYVLAYIAAQLGFIAAAYVKYYRVKQISPLDTAIFPRR